MTNWLTKAYFLGATSVFFMSYTAWCAPNVQRATDVCNTYGTSILVDGAESQLHLCRRGKRVETYRVSFGYRGLGKERVGDRKTPVGTFRLSRPRPSVGGFKTFIGIKIPRRVGIAVGIHGPSRVGRWLGPISTLFNWTAGCIAVSSDAEIAQISSFVREHPRAKIHITKG